MPTVIFSWFLLRFWMEIFLVCWIILLGCIYSEVSKIVLKGLFFALTFCKLNWSIMLNWLIWITTALELVGDSARVMRVNYWFFVLFRGLGVILQVGYIKQPAISASSIETVTRKIPSIYVGKLWMLNNWSSKKCTWIPLHCFPCHDFRSGMGQEARQIVTVVL